MTWKKIKHNENYSISENGKVRNDNTKKLKRPYINKQNGYMYVDLWENNKSTKCPIHRLLAETFIPNPENKPQINHKNGVKTDNRVENIEWCTNEENLEHSMNVLHQNRGSKPVICIETGKRYCSMRQAAIGIGAKGCGGISACCNGKANTASGYHWRYADE